MKMSNLFATMIFSSIVAGASAFADETVPVVPVDNGVKQQLNQDKATVKADKSQLRADKQKLREDRKAARMARKGKGRKHNKKQESQPVQEQPKNT